MNYAEIARWSVVASSVIFGIMLVWGFRKFAVPMITASAKAKNEEIGTAERHLQEMRAKVDQLRAHVADADADAASIRARGTEQARREHDLIVSEAEAAGERALRNASGELERARAAAREQLREELLEKALQSARQEAQTRVTPSVNAQLLDRFIGSIERGGLN